MKKDPISELKRIAELLDKDWGTKKRAAQLGTIQELMYNFVEVISNEAEINWIDTVLKDYGLGNTWTEESGFSNISLFSPGPYIRADFRTSALEHEGILHVFSDCPTFQSSAHWAERFELDKLWVFFGRKNDIYTSISFYRKSQYPTIEELEKLFSKDTKLPSRISTKEFTEEDYKYLLGENTKMYVERYGMSEEEARKKANLDNESMKRTFRRLPHEV